MVAEDGKKREVLGTPPLRGPFFWVWASHPSGPHPSGPHFSWFGPHPSGAQHDTHTRSEIGLAQLGLAQIVQIRMSKTGLAKSVSSVWLRVDQWRTALGRHPRLRCGVLHHVANRTLSFHGTGRDAVQFLLPLFADWTCSSLPQMPSVRSSGARVEFDRPLSNPGRPQSGDAIPQLRPTAVPSPPSDNHSSTGIAGSTPSKVSVLRGLVRRSVDPTTTVSLARGSQSVAG